jgi:hypothetical protein
MLKTYKKKKQITNKQKHWKMKNRQQNKFFNLWQIIIWNDSETIIMTITQMHTMYKPQTLNLPHLIREKLWKKMQAIFTLCKALGGRL